MNKIFVDGINPVFSQLVLLQAVANSKRRHLHSEGVIPIYFQERKPQPLNKSKEMERRKRQMERKREKDRKEVQRFVAAVNEFCERLGKNTCA